MANAAMSFGDIASVKALASTVRFNGLPVVVLDTPANDTAWFVFKAGSSETADDENILAPDVGTGRWIKMNNTSDSSSLIVTETNISGIYEIDVTNTQALRLVFTANSTLDFVTLQRNGKFVLFLDRNGTNSTVSWNDTRLDWSANKNTVFSFNTTDSFAILEFFAEITNKNKIYLTSVTRYA